jgi:hypothetical protein
LHSELSIPCVGEKVGGVAFTTQRVFEFQLSTVTAGTKPGLKEEERGNMRILGMVGLIKGKCLWWTIASLSCLFALSLSALAQSESRSRIPMKAGEGEKSNFPEANSAESQRRAFAVSLVTSLANDARSYTDLALRPRVLARAADAMWDANNVAARALFLRAWEAAEAGDADGARVNTKDTPPAMVIALRKMSGRDLRAEVLSLAARRDKALGEQFLAKLKSENERETSDTKNSGSSRNAFSGSEASLKRLLVASKLLSDGQVDLAREFAAPALTEVNNASIGFLGELRAKDPAGADQIFALLLARTELDPAADANTISGLSSYAFTPGFYVIFWADGHHTWNQPDGPTIPPNLPTALRDRFFQVAANVLLRPLPPPDQDFSSSGRVGRLQVITRLLPLFDLYAPDSATALRAQLSSSSQNIKNGDNPLLTEGVKPEGTAGETLEKMQDQLDHAKNSQERDQIYAAAAVTLAPTGNKRARDLADSIDESKFRAEVRHYVDFEFVKFAIRKKDAVEVAQLAKAEQLTHTERSWTYTQAARLLPESQHERALDFLQEATDETRRIDASDSDRAFALINITNQMLTADRPRAWSLLIEVVKVANSAEDFTADDIWMPKRSMLVTRSGTRFIRMPDEDFNFSRVLRSLAQENLERSVELARGFKYDAPRANATLAIARAILEKPTGNSAKN